MNASVSGNGLERFGSLALDGGALGISLVETQIFPSDLEPHFEPVQVIDLEFPEAGMDPEFTGGSTVSAAYAVPMDWRTCVYVVAKTVEPGSRCRSDQNSGNGAECREALKNFTAEDLMESDGFLRLGGGVQAGGTADAPSFSLKEEELPSVREAGRIYSPFERDLEKEAEAEIVQRVPVSLDRLSVMEIPAELSIVLGRRRLPVAELLKWQVGTVLNLGQKLEESAEVFVNGCCAGSGFPVECENRVGVRLCGLDPDRF